MSAEPWRCYENIEVGKPVESNSSTLGIAL
jgi:hypothetical protein